MTTNDIDKDNENRINMLKGCKRILYYKETQMQYRINIVIVVYGIWEIEHQLSTITWEERPLCWTYVGFLSWEQAIASTITDDYSVKTLRILCAVRAHNKHTKERRWKKKKRKKRKWMLNAFNRRWHSATWHFYWMRIAYVTTKRCD